MMVIMQTEGRKQKIAIVEDDRPIASMYELKLQKAGFDTVIAHNGKDGLDIIQKTLPDLVLLDLRMPIMNGDEMLEKMRATNWGSKIHVIILTNISKDEAPMNLRLLNIDRYIVKAHHTPQQVLGIIKEII